MYLVLINWGVLGAGVVVSALLTTGGGGQSGSPEQKQRVKSQASFLSGDSPDHVFLTFTNYAISVVPFIAFTSETSSAVCAGRLAVTGISQTFVDI